MPPDDYSLTKPQTESGNVLLIVLLAIVLLGVLTAAIQQTSQTAASIDNETLILRAAEVKRTAAEMERGVNFIMQGGLSETDIRFAHPDAHNDYGDLSADTDKTDQLFDRVGGGVTYPAPPENINDGSAWEFYGNTALPEVGTDAAELVTVLPNVTVEFCRKMNEGLGYDLATQPQDSGACIYGGSGARFDDATQFSGTPNTVTAASFSLKPSMQGCVECTSGGTYHYFYVLMAR